MQIRDDLPSGTRTPELPDSTLARFIARLRQSYANMPHGTSDSQLHDTSNHILKYYLENKYKFRQQRFRLAVFYSAAVTGGVFIALFVAFGLNFFGLGELPHQYRLHAEFIEWRSTADYPVCDVICEIRTQGLRLVNAAEDIGASILSAEAGHYGNVAGIARLCTLIAVTVVVWSTYRKQLLPYYTYHLQFAQRAHFEEMPTLQFVFSRGLYTIASLFGTYVMVSVAWLALSQVFKNVMLDRFNAAIVVVAFTSVVTFATAYGALVANTRIVLLLGLATFFVGFASSFALSPIINDQQWWASAVSNAGQLNPSAPIFTGTLLSGSTALFVLWYDLSKIIDNMITDGFVGRLSAAQWKWVVRVLYGALILGLLAVGLVRVDDANFPDNKYVHAGGAVAAVTAVIISALLIRKHRFPLWYRTFSVHILLGFTIIIVFFGSLLLNPPPLQRFLPGMGPISMRFEQPDVLFVFPGTGLIGLTVIELTLLALIGLWVYATVDTMLDVANIRAF